MDSKAPEQMQSARWSGDVGERWNRYRDRFEGMIAGVGAAVIAHARFRRDERVIDVGCGAGATSLQIAKIVEDGHVTGLDVSATLIGTCRERATQSGLTNVDFVVGDAAKTSMSGYDHVFSRFGVMFFEDPYAAFANLRSFLNDDGRMTFACWGPPPQNPWAFDMMDIVRRYVELPPPEPNAPGPFAFADPSYVRDILEKAGFGQIDFTPWTGEQPLGGAGASPAEAAQFVIDATFVGEAIEPETAEVKDRIRADITAHLAGLVKNGAIAAKGMAWFVTAER